MDRIPNWADEWFVTTTIIIFGLVIVDFLMGPTARRALRDRVGYWWLVLDNISLEGIYQSVTRWTLARLKHIVGPRVLSIRFFGSSFMIFGCITVIAITVFVFLGIHSGEYAFFSIHKRILIPRNKGALLTQSTIFMQLDRVIRLGPWEATRCLSIAFFLPNILVGTLSLIITRFVFQSIDKSRRLHTIVVLTISNIVLSLSLVAIPYFIGFLAYRIQFFHAVAAQAIYDVPGLGGHKKMMYSEGPLNLMSYTHWSFLRYDFVNTMLRLLNQEPLVREITQLIVSHKDGSASLIIVLEPDYGYKALNFFDQDVAIEGGFTQVFQIRTMAYLLFLLIAGLSVLPVLINVILSAVLGLLRSAESVLRPMSAFILRRLYEDGRPVLSILAVITGAMLKVIQELIKRFL
jgi:hypothetical protein